MLSEGTTTYLTARALEAVEGALPAQALWQEYAGRLGPVGSHAAWPALESNACDTNIDPLMIYTDLIYFRGAFFFRAVEERIGRSSLDTALRNIAVHRQGEALRFTEFLDEIELEGGWDPTPCAQKWLGRSAPPEPNDFGCR